MSVETAVYLKDILKLLRWSERRFRRNREELLDAGVIFYRKEGRPRARRVYAFPSELRHWIKLKSRRREPI